MCAGLRLGGLTVLTGKCMLFHHLTNIVGVSTDLGSSSDLGSVNVEQTDPLRQ